MSVSTRLEPAFVSVSPATTAESVLHLRNTGEIVEAYRFELVGVPAEWGVVEPAELSLYPGTSGTVVVGFSPPGGTEPEAGRYPFAVRAVPVERPDEVQVPEGVVEVLSAADLEAGLLARTRHGRLGARFQIAVRNAGNTTATLAAGAAEPDGKLKFRARPGPEDFSPGDEGHFRIRARPRRPMLKGRARTHAFRVTVTLREVARLDETEAEADSAAQAADGTDSATASTTPTSPTATTLPLPLPETPPVPNGASAPTPKTAPLPEAMSKTVDAVFEQRPLLPPGAGKVAAAVVALAALCAAAWFALVKPAVTSAADTTASHVAATAAAQQAASNAAAQAASQAGHPGSSTPGGSATPSPSPSPSKKPAPSGATTPTPTPTTAPATSPPASKPSPAPTATTVTVTVSPTAPAPSTSPKPTTTTTTANFDTALAVQPKPGQSGTATFTTPARSTFMITDYVLENPQGDYGTITVNVNGAQVSTLALENFRDDDYPWVTPLAVPAGAHVTITVNCGAPGAPPNVAPPTTCSESALFNGTMTTTTP